MIFDRCFIFQALVLSAATGWAADKPPANAAPSEPPASPAVQASDSTTKAPSTAANSEAAAADAAEFQKKFGQFKDVMARLRDVQGKLQVAPVDKRPALVNEFNAEIERGRKLVPEMMDAAEKAYLAAPNKDRTVSDFLVSAIDSHNQRDNYEEALRIARLLIDHHYPDSGVLAKARVAAFATNDYAAARQYHAALGGVEQADARTQQMLKELDNCDELWKAEKSLRQAEAKADDLPRVKLSTTKGDIVIELFENEAPNTVANFISLVEKKFYDGVPFHRVIPQFMAQTGDPKGDGSGGPGYTIACECYEPNHRSHFRGSVSMAHKGRDSGGSQFYITFFPTTHLNGLHTVFGRVIEGMDVLAKLERTEASNPNIRKPPVTPDKIQTATVVRKRDHAYTPKTTAEK